MVVPLGIDVAGRLDGVDGPGGVDLLAWELNGSGLLGTDLGGLSTGPTEVRRWQWSGGHRPGMRRCRRRAVGVQAEAHERWGAGGGVGAVGVREKASKGGAWWTTVAVVLGERGRFGGKARKKQACVGNVPKSPGQYYVEHLRVSSVLSRVLDIPCIYYLIFSFFSFIFLSLLFFILFLFFSSFYLYLFLSFLFCCFFFSYLFFI